MSLAPRKYKFYKVSYETSNAEIIGKILTISATKQRFIITALKGLKDISNTLQ